SRHQSKKNLHGNLNDPWIARSRHLAEGRAAEARLPERIATATPAGPDLPLCVIKRVEEFEACLQGDLFGNPVALLHGKIPIVHTRRPQNISTAVAGREQGWKPESRGIEIDEPIAAHMVANTALVGIGDAVRTT